MREGRSRPMWPFPSVEAFLRRHSRTVVETGHSFPIDTSFFTWNVGSLQKRDYKKKLSKKAASPRRRMTTYRASNPTQMPEKNFVDELLRLVQTSPSSLLRFIGLSMSGGVTEDRKTNAKMLANEILHNINIGKATFRIQSTYFGHNLDFTFIPGTSELTNAQFGRISLPLDNDGWLNALYVELLLIIANRYPNFTIG